MGGFGLGLGVNGTLRPAAVPTAETVVKPASLAHFAAAAHESGHRLSTIRADADSADWYGDEPGPIRQNLLRGFMLSGLSAEEAQGCTASVILGLWDRILYGLLGCVFS